MATLLTGAGVRNWLYSQVAAGGLARAYTQVAAGGLTTGLSTGGSGRADNPLSIGDSGRAGNPLSTGASGPAGTRAYPQVAAGGLAIGHGRDMDFLPGVDAGELEWLTFAQSGVVSTRQAVEFIGRSTVRTHLRHGR